jgi:hypothetical protein
MDRYNNLFFLASILILVLVICKDRKKNNLEKKIILDRNNRDINNKISIDSKIINSDKLVDFNEIETLLDHNDREIVLNTNNNFNKKDYNNKNNGILMDINEVVINKRDKDIKKVSDKKLNLSSKFLKKDYILNKYMIDKENEIDDFDYTIKRDSNNLLERPKISTEYNKPITSEMLNNFEGMKIKDIYDSLTKNNDLNDMDVTSKGISADYVYTNCQSANSEY